jgi:hypothetical protein
MHGPDITITIHLIKMQSLEHIRHTGIYFTFVDLVAMGYSMQLLPVSFTGHCCSKHTSFRSRIYGEILGWCLHDN